MKYNKVMVLSDNVYLTEEFISIIGGVEDDVSVSVGMSPSSKGVLDFERINVPVTICDVKYEVDDLIKNNDIIFSLHCKQYFPKNLVERVKCVNVHPGLNPYNRGWYPQVFAIINGLPHGATIHEMDSELDHGPIICQKEVEIYSDDTSLSVYEKVLDAEVDLLKRYTIDILNGNYSVFFPGSEGNLNTINDYHAVCELNLSERGEFRWFLNKIRALSHGDYNNAYYIDDLTGDRVYVKISLERDRDD